jgi:hypothetical protein
LLKNTEVFYSDLITEILNRGSGNTLRNANPTLKRRIREEPEDDGAQVINTAIVDHATTPAEQLEELELSIQQTDHLFSLPLYTQELGLLPVYESFDFQCNFGLEQTPSPSSSSNPNLGLNFSPLDGAYVNGVLFTF